MPSNVTRYEIELHIPERRPELSDHEANALLHSVFQLALNASHFIALSADDPQITIGARTIGHDGVARYELLLDFVHRPGVTTVETAIALVRSEFQRAINSSQFVRIAAEDEDPAVISVTPVRAGDAALIRRAA